MSIKPTQEDEFYDGRDPISMYVCTRCGVPNFSTGICIGCGHDSLVERESTDEKLSFSDEYTLQTARDILAGPEQGDIVQVRWAARNLLRIIEALGKE